MEHLQRATLPLLMAIQHGPFLLSQKLFVILNWPKKIYIKKFLKNVRLAKYCYRAFPRIRRAVLTGNAMRHTVRSSSRARSHEGIREAG